MENVAAEPGEARGTREPRRAPAPGDSNGPRGKPQRDTGTRAPRGGRTAAGDGRRR
jgi:hypothetical protein